MLIYKMGDLLKSNCTTIMHQANCMSVMGGGIAKSIANLYPEAKIVDKEYPYAPEEKLGKFSYVTIDEITVVNLYGQLRPGIGLQTNYEKLEQALDNFLSFAKTNDDIDLTKVGVPYKIGSGLAGGEWNIVRNMLQRQSDKHNINIYIYKLQ